jgi:hypothetical protein
MMQLSKDLILGLVYNPLIHLMLPFKSDTPFRLCGGCSGGCSGAGGGGGVGSRDGGAYGGGDADQERLNNFLSVFHYGRIGPYRPWKERHSIIQ